MKINLKYILAIILILILISNGIYQNRGNIKKWGNEKADTLIKEANEEARNRGTWNSAYSKYSIALLISSNSYYKSWAHSCRGLISWKRYKRWKNENDFNKALYDYNKAIQLEKKCYTAALENKALLYESHKDYDLALEFFDKAIKCDSKYSKAYEDKTSLLFDIGKYQEAIDFGKKGLEQFGQSDDLFFYIAYSYEMLGDYKKAIEYYDKELKFNNYKSWWTYTNASYCKLMLKDWLGAVEYAQSSIKLHEESAENNSRRLNQNIIHPYNFIAFAALEMGKLDLATQYNNKAFNLYTPPNYLSFYNYARIKHLQGDNAGAKQRLDRARELFEKDTETWQFDGFLDLCDKLEKQL